MVKRTLFALGLALLATPVFAQASSDLQDQLAAAKRQLARLELQLIEKDRQLTAAQLEASRKLLDAAAAVAQCQIQTRAERAAEHLRELEHPAPGSTFNLQTGEWTPPEKKPS